ncbi:hypothetical protein [Bacillus kwashiorkori]|uniref:hypothetical protein n=1 Tax=Bacillus kwashiorkori TaxID=1522318 RepID=UPI000784DB1E|nr:hypothetical protein [Bacillus kwashiorkori]
MERPYLLDLPYEERKYIHIIKDEPLLMLDMAEMVSLTNPIVGKGLKVAKAIKNKTMKNRIESQTYKCTRSQVYGVLFPEDGIPLNNTTYICNPIDTRRYYRVDDFHQEMANHKIYEAMYLLRSLGAAEINVFFNEEIHKNADIGFTYGKLSSNNSYTSNRNERMDFQTTYEPSSQPPFIPDDIYWYKHEAQWRQIAIERINRQLKTFKLTVEITDDFGINADIVAILKEKQATASGHYKEFKKTSLVISGRFR